jgi:acylphosphatase
VIEIFAIIEGVVQGVGFRARVTRLANQQNLTGWVRNLSDGRVEMAVQGSREELSRFFSQLKQLPSPIVVRSICKQERQIAEIYTLFSIRVDDY